MDFDYFYGRGADQFAFYQIPKILITDEKFAGITMESKILYSLMLDRASLSAKNGWLDEDGKVFIYYKLDRIMADIPYFLWKNKKSKWNYKSCAYVPKPSKDKEYQFDYVVTVVVPRMSHYKLMELYYKKSGILHGSRLLNKKSAAQVPSEN